MRYNEFIMMKINIFTIHLLILDIVMKFILHIGGLYNQIVYKIYCIR